MRSLLVVFLFVCLMFNTVFLFAQQNSDTVNKRTLISKDAESFRQEADVVNKEFDAELEKTNAEVEEIRLKAQEQALVDEKQAAKDLDSAIQEFQKEKFPEAIEGEKSLEGK